MQHSNSVRSCWPEHAETCRTRLTAVGAFQLPALQSGTLSRILFGTRPSVQTVSDVCLKCIRSLDTGVFSALEVLSDNCAI